MDIIVRRRWHATRIVPKRIVAAGSTMTNAAAAEALAQRRAVADYLGVMARLPWFVFDHEKLNEGMRAALRGDWALMDQLVRGGEQIQDALPLIVPPPPCKRFH